MMRAVLTAAMLMLTSTAIAQTPAPTPGKWEIINQSSPLTGARTTGGSLASSNMLANTLGYEARASLVVRCAGESGLAVYVNWPQVVRYDSTNMMGMPKTMAVWRIDDGKVEANLWDIDSTGTSAGEFQHKNAVKMLARIVYARKLVVRLTGRQTQDAEFDLTGIERVGTDAAAACGITFKR